MRIKWFFVSLVILFILTYFAYTNRYLLLHYAIKNIYQVNLHWSGNTYQKIVALTFDDGPDPSYTPKILTILNQYKVPATFFVQGVNVLHYPLLLKKEVQSGFEIGNHSFSHPHLANQKTKEITRELELTDHAIETVIGTKPRWFRPPYEEITPSILRASRLVNKSIILSNITLEHSATMSPRTLAKRVANLVFPGAIILMHDGRLNRHSTVKALPYLLNNLSAKGYRIVPLHDLL